MECRRMLDGESEKGQNLWSALHYTTLRQALMLEITRRIFF